jgi:Pyruvate/2-oxoacid:ferredoxin oxidoreductase delta subunit
MPFKNSEENINNWHQNMIELISKRKHQLISGKMTSHQREECYTVYCPEHDLSMDTSFFNYKRSRTGCVVCGRESVSQKLSGREFSLESLEKMKVSARSRPDRGGKPRRWRETHDYRVFTALVRKEWNNQCAITGTKNVVKGDGSLVVHHLIGVSRNEVLALTIENGILIHKDFHTTFHSLYGYRDNTVEQFMDFIKEIANNEIVVPISSQAESEGSEGSETRVYDPERIMELYERLSEIKDILDTIL